MYICFNDLRYSTLLRALGAVGTSCAASRRRCPRPAGWRGPAAAPGPRTVPSASAPRRSGAPCLREPAPAWVVGRWRRIPAVAPAPGGRRPAEDRERGRPPRSRPRSTVEWLPSRVALFPVRLRPGDPQQGRDFFLNVDDDLGLLQFLLHLQQFGFQFAVLLGQGVAGRLPAALLGQSAQGARFAQPPPLDQVGLVQPLAPQQSADRARIGGGVGLLDDAQLVLGGELATLGFGRDFEIGSRRGRGSPRVGNPSATGGFAPLASLRSRAANSNMLESPLSFKSPI